MSILRVPMLIMSSNLNKNLEVIFNKTISKDISKFICRLHNIHFRRAARLLQFPFCHQTRFKALKDFSITVAKAKQNGANITVHKRINNRLSHHWGTVQCSTSIVHARQGCKARQSACLSVHSHISWTTCTNFVKFSVNIKCGCSSVLLWQQCKKSCTSGFVDDVVLSCNVATGAESKTTLCFVKFTRWWNWLWVWSAVMPCLKILFS